MNFPEASLGRSEGGVGGGGGSLLLQVCLLLDIKTILWPLVHFGESVDVTAALTLQQQRRHSGCLFFLHISGLFLAFQGFYLTETHGWAAKWHPGNSGESTHFLFVPDLKDRDKFLGPKLNILHFWESSVYTFKIQNKIPDTVKEADYDF